MSYAKIDFIFPFFVFFYGFLITFVQQVPALESLGKDRMPEAWAKIRSHALLAWVSLFVGGLWSLQNIWFSYQ